MESGDTGRGVAAVPAAVAVSAVGGGMDGSVTRVGVIEDTTTSGTAVPVSAAAVNAGGVVADPRVGSAAGLTADSAEITTGGTAANSSESAANAAAASARAASAPTSSPLSVRPSPATRGPAEALHEADGSPAAPVQSASAAAKLPSPSPALFGDDDPTDEAMVGAGARAGSASSMLIGCPQRQRVAE
jgi:hypothetical protein